MRTLRQSLPKLVSCLALLHVLVATQFVLADTKAEREVEARAALDELFSTSPTAKVMVDNAAGVLVFPSVTKGGFIVGGQFGKGALFRNNRVVGYYNTASASYGLQAGLQKFGYALIFMQEKDLKYLDKSDGWEVGVGPSITLVDTGLARSLSTTTAREGVFAFFFAQKGLMAGIGLQGTKITEVHPKG